jgi:hypothetical protein
MREAGAKGLKARLPLEVTDALRRFDPEDPVC